MQEAMSLPGTCLKTVQEVLTRFLVHASTSQSLPQEVDRRQLEAQLQQACCPAGALTLLKILSCREVVQLHEAFGGHVDSGQSPAKLIDALLHTWSQVGFFVYINNSLSFCVVDAAFYPAAPRNSCPWFVSNV